MKAQISLHIYMGSVLCRPHIKRVCCCHEERKKKTKKGRMEHWEKESVGEEIMNSRKKIKRERNQGGVMRGQRDVAETLNEKEMGSWDKEVKKIKRRYDSSKEIKEHLHFAFLIRLSRNQSSLKADTSPHSKCHQSEWVILTNWAAREMRMLFWLRRGAADSGESTAGQRYNYNWPLHSPSPNLWPRRAAAGENGTASTDRLPQQLNALRPRISTMSEMLCARIRTIWEIHP